MGSKWANIGLLAALLLLMAGLIWLDDRIRRLRRHTLLQFRTLWTRIDGD